MKHAIDYVEFSSPNLEETQEFFTKAFGWEFVDYGPDYKDIQGAGIGGGLERAPNAAPVVILKSNNLEVSKQTVLDAGALLTKDIYGFPGGRRFEFREPGGTLMAVWQPL